MKEIEQVVFDYLQSENTDFAIMIYGDWGCGKTYYVKKVLFEKMSKIDSFSKDSNNIPLKYEPLYISLYGLTDISEILYKIQLELNPWLKSKPWLISKTLINKVSSFFRIGVSKDDEKNFLSIFNISKSKVIIFDDLERIDQSKLSLSSVLGQVNNLTEQDNLKVIIVCNSSEIEKIFSKINEKTIRFSCKYTPELEDVFTNIVMNYSEEYRNYLNTQKELLLKIFKIAEYQNLRTLRFILDIFQKMYNQKYGIEFKNEILYRFFLFLTIYSIEFKKGREEDELNSLEKVDSYPTDLLPILDEWFPKETDKSSEKKPEYWKLIKEKYKNIIDSFHYYKEIVNYIHNGYLNEIRFKDTIEASFQEIGTRKGTEEDILINKLKDWINLDDDELMPLLEKIIQKIDSGNFSLYAYPVIYAELMQIEFFIVDNFQITNDITQKFKNGINKAKENHKYIESFEHKIPVWNTRDTSERKDKYNEIYNYAVDANNYVLNKEYEQIAIQLLKLIENNISEDLKDLLSDRKNIVIPIFKYLNASVIYDILKKSNSKTVNAFNESLYMRYPEHSFSLITIDREKHFFTELQNLIENYLSEIQLIKISTVRFRELDLNLKRIITYNKET